ncbi:putative phosphatidylglycerol/phosphatidylinositol transfer protein DDB_G0282179 [Momordica charantia]|uniref:Phosphatidylglycerol/phosphatidylinositol transfer protein DDB_G0282179 n=1 Tax=Momordica charantia TaxID=3673 RepID=A0A6J1CKB6_MOMCH|nr:putative phosphatidylglycerol/phosphatidylinositol transfer protein DDB_G0282179 [Momordica charantia]
MAGGLSFDRILVLFFAVHLLFPAIFAAKFNYCDKRGNYAVKVAALEVSPDPVKSGKPATFTVSASTDKVLSGGKFGVEVSLFGMHIHSEAHDLCEVTSCPVVPGKFSLAHSQSLPPFTPPGSYSVKILLKDNKNRQLTCINFKLKIVFGDGESAISEESLVAES